MAVTVTVSTFVCSLFMRAAAGCGRNAGAAWLLRALSPDHWRVAMASRSRGALAMHFCGCRSRNSEIRRCHLQQPGHVSIGSRVAMTGMAPFSESRT